MTLTDLAVLFRALQLFAHNAHNLASGITFFEDHEFLGELYATYEESYDKVVELIIGDVGTLDLIKVQQDAVAIVAEMKWDAFPTLYKAEIQIQKSVDEIAVGVTDQGVIQTIGTLAEASKVRKYKIGRRII